MLQIFSTMLLCRYVKTIPSSLKDVSYLDKIAWNGHNVFHHPTNYTDVLKALFNLTLEKSVGYDGFSMNFLRSCYDNLPLLVLLVNKSIEERILP